MGVFRRGVSAALAVSGDWTSGKRPSKSGSKARIRATSGGCVAKRFSSEPAKASPKNMWLISSAWASRIREPSARPPIFFSAPAIPPG